MVPASAIRNDDTVDMIRMDRPLMVYGLVWIQCLLIFVSIVNTFGLGIPCIYRMDMYVSILPFIFLRDHRS
jgi:hypothetical protein